MLVKLDFIKESWMAKDQGETLKIRAEIFFKKQKEEEKFAFRRAAGKDVTHHYLISYFHFHTGLQIKCWKAD